MIVLIAGGSGSGKSTLADKFIGTNLSCDSFYIGIDKMTPMENGDYNFDDPRAVDLAECARAAKELEKGNEVLIPDYDMVSSRRVGTIMVYPNSASNIVVVEGIFALQSPLAEIGDLKIFIDTPIDQRVARRIRRDTDRGRSALETIRWSINVEEAYKQYVEPTRTMANLILGREGW